jgi:mRNA interferase HigB
VRIITETQVLRFARQYPRAASALENWRKAVKAARWQSLGEVRRTYPHADATRDVKSGREVTIFNICGNSYRLITAIHYNTGKLFVMRFMDHEEYDKERWKQTL